VRSVRGADEDFLLFAGSASRLLGRRIADYLGIELGASETLRFSEGNLFVRVLENVRLRRPRRRRGAVPSACQATHASPRLRRGPRRH
jgi:hypothetical protein